MARGNPYDGLTAAQGGMGPCAALYCPVPPPPKDEWESWKPFWVGCCLSSIRGTDFGVNFLNVSAVVVGIPTLLQMGLHLHRRGSPFSCTALPPPSVIPQSSCPAGEQLKTHGNQKMAGGQYREAVGYYTKAIEMDGQAAIYYANRAAAHTHLKDYGQRPFKDPWSGGGAGFRPT